MANQSKTLFADHFKSIVLNVLVGSRSRQAVSLSIVALVGVLIFIRRHG